MWCRYIDEAELVFNRQCDRYCTTPRGIIVTGELLSNKNETGIIRVKEEEGAERIFNDKIFPCCSNVDPVIWEYMKKFKLNKDEWWKEERSESKSFNALIPCCGEDDSREMREEKGNSSFCFNIELQVIYIYTREYASWKEWLPTHNKLTYNKPKNYWCLWFFPKIKA